MIGLVFLSPLSITLKSVFTYPKSCSRIILGPFSAIMITTQYEVALLTTASFLLSLMLSYPLLTAANDALTD